MEEAARRGLTLAGRTADVGPPLSFREFVAKVAPRYRWYRHCEILIDVLQRVADGKIKRLLVFMPPRHGKSELVSRLFSAYWLYRFPHQWVGLNSYGSDLAYMLSRAAQENFIRAGGMVKGNAGAVKHWETLAGGGMWAAGVGGPITGKGWHLGIIDDSVKNAEEAASETIQGNQREWYGSTFYTREEPDGRGNPDGALIDIQTRWNELDLAGWLLDEETADEDPERWHVVSFEAIKEETPPEFPASCTVEPDWRQPGEALCPERRPLEKLRRIRNRIGEYFFAALFQQRPRPRDGGMFQRPWFPIVRALPADCTRLRYWDKAGTAGGGAFTVGVLMARSPEGRYFVADIVRGQWSAGDREAVIKQTATRDGTDVEVWVEQEPGSGGKESAENTVIALAGFDAHAERVTGEKETRARPLAAQAEVGNVALLEGDWNGPFLREAEAFPWGKYKDQVDAASGAFNKLALKPCRELQVIESPFGDTRW